MEQPKYIEKKQQIPEAMDFNFLRSEGIRRIQELTGAFWTDYNLHDPGVTILEQLCYGITDLAYRTSIDIEQHLFTGRNERLPFFRPEDTLTNGAVTIEDYRKIFIDEIQGLRNIWFEPVAQFECGFNGLYRILVDVSDYGLSKEKDHNEILAQIRTLFSKCRNIGEDIYEINILEELPVKVHADIETDGIHELELILAKIYFVVEQLLAPEIKFYSLNELKSKGLDYGEIYSGPRLKHGFILTEDLKSQQNVIIVSDIVRSIMQIEGVVSVKQLMIEIDEKMHHSQLNIPVGKIPRIITSDLFSGSGRITSEIKFFKGSLEYTSIIPKTFKRFLNELVAENKKSFRISESSIELNYDLGDDSISEYYSIQNHFPSIYGVGAEGIPGRPDMQRIAKSKQLKAYLMIFEQFMSNYLSQLSHFKDIFSLHKKSDQTYYTQTLDNVPNSSDLLIDGEGNINDAYLDIDHIPEDYYQGLVKLTQMFDNFVDRKNRFLDFLLAIHGETLSQYTLNQFNFYYSDEEFDKHLIRCKTALLQNLGDLNYARQTGFDYLTKEKHMLSGLEKRLSLFLGFGVEDDENNEIVIKKTDSVLEQFRDARIRLVGTKGYSKFRSTWLKKGALEQFGIEQHEIEDKFDFIDDKDFLDLVEDEELSKKLLSGLLPYKTALLYAGFLSDGIDLQRYKIGRSSNPEAKFVLAYDFNSSGEWIAMGSFKDQKETLYAVNALISDLKKINIRSEGLNMVEHILLRPAPERRMYGVYIDDINGNHILKSEKQYSLSERTELLKIIQDNLTKDKYFSVDADENRDMNIIFDIPKTELKFKSIKPNASVEETHAQKEDLFDFLADVRMKIPFSKKIGFYIQYNEKERDIPEEFFSFQVSLVMPNWSARFQNAEFRSIALDIVLEQKPANIFTNMHWLEPEDMIRFEELNRKWKEDLTSRDSEKGEEDKFLATAEMANFLYSKIENEE